jgi:hypothetical protein
METFIGTGGLSRSILVGKTTGGLYNDISIEPTTNNLNVALPRTAFGELECAAPTPIIQVDFIYNINTDVVNTDTTGIGSITQSNAMAVLQTGASTSSSVKISTKNYVKYRPGQGVHTRQTAIFTTGVDGCEQLAGCGDDDNGLFFGYNGNSFGIMRRSGGVDTWTAQTSWNGDVMDGSNSENNPSGMLLDQTKGNVYQIQFQHLGFGQQLFFIEDAETGNFINVHAIKYANNNTVPSLLNPSFPIMWSIENTTNATNMTLYGSSCAAEIEGEVQYLGPRNSLANDKTSIGTTLTNILTIRNKTTFASKVNKTSIQVLNHNIAVDGTKSSIVELVKNATIGGSPSYTDVSTNTSVIEYDTAGTTVTGGQILSVSTLAPISSISENDNFFIYPGETLTLAVRATSASTTDASVGLRWVEDF